METNTQRLIHTFATLADLGQEIANTADFEEMLRASFHLLLGSLAIRRGAVAEYDREREQLRFVAARGLGQDLALDRKSTRLNSSHLVISYAVFCLKKKKKKRIALSAPSIV